MTKVIVKIPFDGFYNTLHDHAMDREIDNILEDREDDLEISYDDLVIDNTAYMIQYCKNYVDLYNEKFEEETGLKLNLQFDETRSPREYNFANDEIYCTAKLSDLRRMYGFTMINRERLQAFSDMVVEQCTSRDGFHSFYSNDVKEWPGTDEWDHNHWHLMMLSILGDLAEECLEDTRFYELPNQYVTINYPYMYYINLDERGDFYADVRNNAEETIFEIHGYEFFEDGFVKDKDDIDGLLQYLQHLELVGKDAKLIKGL